MINFWSRPAGSAVECFASGIGCSLQLSQTLDNSVVDTDVSNVNPFGDILVTTVIVN